MKIEVVTEVTACDIDQRTPALTYTISASDGRIIEVDLCDEHSTGIESLLSDFSHRPGRTKDTLVPAAHATAPERKATPGRTAATARKTSAAGRRRTRVVSLEEIEAMKKSARRGAP